MKKKIAISLAIFWVVSILTGTYIILSIDQSTSTLDKLLKLHQVEILREHLLIQLKKVQADLVLKDTHHASELDAVVTHVLNLGKVINTCFECHHAPSVEAKLTDLKVKHEAYKNSLNRVFTIKENEARQAKEEDEAYQLGTDLFEEVNTLIALAYQKLELRTTTALKEIALSKRILALSNLLVPLIAVMLAFLLFRSFTKPVSVLLDATRRLEKGDLDHRIEGLKDEFGEVAASFNAMAGSLKKQMLEMQRTEQMVVIGEMATAMAHEIKNPLAAIKISIEVLFDELELEKEYKEVMVKIIEEIKRIEQLMKSLLSFARPPKPQLDAVDVNKVVEDTAVTMHYMIKNQKLNQPSKEIKLVKELGPHIPIITADPSQLRQVFINLMLNGLEAMSDGGTLTITTSFERRKNAALIQISDTGIGMDQDQIERIFKPFFTTKANGTGLGLAISKRLIEQQYGTITVTSTPGVGSTFQILFPINVHDRAQATP